MSDAVQSPVDRILSQLQALNVTDRVTYDKVQVEASGGYGDIYKGRLRRISSPGATETADDDLIVAVKTMRAILQNDKSFAKVVSMDSTSYSLGDEHTQSFAKEMYVWAKIDHPNIVKLEGFALGNGYPSLISEWMVNGTVLEYVKKHPDRNLVDIASGIAKGVAYLHEDRDVIHSDLKSANILVNANGQPMLTDFGLSRMINYSQTFLKTTSYDLTKGSARWMAYELLCPADMEPAITGAASNVRHIDHDEERD